MRQERRVSGARDHACLRNRRHPVDFCSSRGRNKGVPLSVEPQHGHLHLRELRAQIGMVQQDSSLLHRSVRDNIVYARPGATEGEIAEAARQAEAHDFILDLEDPQGRKGYDAHVGERGVRLGIFQRQRAQ